MIATVTFALSGCGGFSPNDAIGTPRYMTTLAVLSEYLTPFDDAPSQEPRWLDVGDNPYAITGTFESFIYPPETVLLRYTTQETPLAFTVEAPRHALKPNFCYQIKLEGPSKPWERDPGGKDFVNAQLGYNGRWWCDTCNASLDDNTVNTHMRRSHYVKGYLLFGFIVTDADGGVNQTVVVDSSYHVIWKSSQRSRGANDGPITAISRTITPDGWAYDTDCSINEQLYTEWESSRPLPGDLVLAEGAYNGVQLRLTEESFHSTNPLLGGEWRTVLVADDLGFVIGEEPTVYSWASAASHGTSTELAVPCSEGWVESRSACISTLLVTCSEPIDPVTVDTGCVQITGVTNLDQSSLVKAVTVEGDGKVLRIALSAALPDQDSYTLTISGPCDLAGNPLGGDRNILLHELHGDANGNGTVDIGDLLAVRGRFGTAVDEDSARYDVNRNGTIDIGDMLYVRSNFGHQLPIARYTSLNRSASERLVDLSGRPDRPTQLLEAVQPDVRVLHAGRVRFEDRTRGRATDGPAVRPGE